MENTLNLYLMAIKYVPYSMLESTTSSYEEFEIEATDKEDAIKRAKVFVQQDPRFNKGDYRYDDIKCIKKLQRKGKNRYQCSIDHFTGAKTLFEIEAADKASALIAAKDYARKHIQWGGNFFENTIKVIKKIKKMEK